MRSTDKRLPAFLAAALAGALLPWAAGAVPLLISAGPTEEAVPEGERPSAVAVCAQPEESCSSLAGWEALPVAGKETKDVFSDIQLQLQNPELPNGCEVTSLAMLLTAAGYPVDKLELYEYLPREEFSYSGSARLGPNPQEAFAGDPASASGGWYCLEGPVVKTGNRWLQSSGGSAEMVNLTGLEQSQLNALLEEGTPLVVWITQEYEEPAYRESFTWTLPDSTQYIPYDNLHCVVVVGTEGDAYRVADPIRGWQSVDQEAFWKSFDGMGRRAVTVDKGLKGEAGETLAAFSQEDSTGELDIAQQEQNARPELAGQVESWGSGWLDGLKL